MKTGRLFAVVLALLVSSAAVLAQEEEAETPAPKTVKVQVKQYRDIDADSVYQAALRGIPVDVRFRDTFDQRVPVPLGMERVDIGAASYPVALAFRTRTDLFCLVPAVNRATVAQLLGVPANVPLGPRALDLPVILNTGQELAIEGTVLGTVRGRRFVLVDSVNAGLRTQRPPQREVHLFWPTQAEPRIIAGPGKQTFEFPCTHVEDKTDSVTVSVDALSPDQLDAQLAALQGRLEGLAAGRKVYGQYTARTVYRYAGDGEVIDVDFTDQVQDVIDPLPPALSTAPALRLGYQVQVPIVRAFRMVNRPTILIPNTWPTVVQEAATVIPGETLRVRGTTFGVRGINNCVLVDSLSFPDEQPAGQDSKAWWVSIEWPDVKQPFTFWDYGQYRLQPLPCQNQAGQFEALNVLISLFREYELPPPPAAPEAQPAPEKPPAEK